ncbi:MAG: cytochrome c-type biogenesis protein CcmH [Candidatus Binatia bacterium]
MHIRHFVIVMAQARYLPWVIFLLLTFFCYEVRAATPTTQEVEESLTCQCSCGLTVHSCNHLQCSFAVPAKQRIAEQVSQGKSKEAILKEFVSRYGEKVLSAPTTEGFNLAAWIMPFFVVLVGGGTVAFVGLRWSHKRATQTENLPNPDPQGTDAEQYRNRLRKELDEYDV